jgi:segregation and condensation protein A
MDAPKSRKRAGKVTASFVVNPGFADLLADGSRDRSGTEPSGTQTRGTQTPGAQTPSTQTSGAETNGVETNDTQNTGAVGPKYAQTIAEKAAQAGGIEILIKLATSGEIDPKNIDIIDVTDKFLKAIAAVPKENLRQSGKILFHASVLLRMKAEAMLAAATVEVDSGDDFMDFGEDGSFDANKMEVVRQLTLADLERALVRKANNRQNRQRKVTLDQLIDALREAEKIERTRSAREPRHRVELSGQHDANDFEDLLDLAHDEDIEDTISRVENIMASHMNTGELVHLLRIIQMLGGHGDWVDAFLAVLFLSNAGKITLEQNDFYGPLYVVRSDAAVPPINIAQ